MSHEPTESDFSTFLPGQNVEDDRALIPEFFIEKKLMGFKSEQAGRPIYEDREYVRIFIKGQDKNIPVHEVNDNIRRRFPISYAAFQQNKPMPVVGTPIEMMPGIGPSMVHSLKGLHIRSVEDLASVTVEETIQRIGVGARDLIKNAKAWIAKSSPQVVQLNEQLAAEKLAREEAEKKAAEDRAEFEARLKALEGGKKGKKTARRAPSTPEVRT